jgi:large subunit ribosomal protein L18
MESSQTKKFQARKKRSLRVRKHLRGNGDKPRLCVVKTGAHLYVQLIDDEKAITLASVSTLSKEYQDTDYNRKNKESGKQLGLKIASLAKQKNVNAVIFDRGRSKYHGVIASVADGAREGGLQL